MAELFEEIRAARKYGVVHCGVISLSDPTPAAVAHAFGLRSDDIAYREIDEVEARSSAISILFRDLAYNTEVMPLPQAERLADSFLAQFGSDGKYFTNNWTPATEATFDAGILVIGQKLCGCLWVEDED